ncbi:MAG: GNAT family N-acetyltransferase [Halobacteriota archaeon]
MVVELLEDKKRWDQFVETSPQGYLFHKWDFLKTVERHSKYKLLPYSVYSGDELVCIFPFFITRDRLGMTYMFSPPPLDTQILYLGPAFDPSVQALKATAKETVFAQVTNELCEEIDKIAPNYVAFMTVPNFIDVRFFIWKKYRGHARFTYAIDLEKSLDEIWASFSKKCRHEIKRVSSHSPEIQQTNDVNPMLDTWRARFSELGVQAPLLSDSYIKELVATFPQDITVYNLIIDGKLATAGSCCVLQKERYATWVGGVNVRKGLSVVDYLIWEFVKQAKSEGFKKLDLTSGDARLNRYKAKFDPVLEPLCFVEKTDRLGKTVNFAWKRLSGARKLVRDAFPRTFR